MANTAMTALSRVPYTQISGIIPQVYAAAYRRRTINEELRRQGGLEKHKTWILNIATHHSNPWSQNFGQFVLVAE